MSRRMRRPETVKLDLADVYVRAHAELLKRTKPQPPSPEEIAQSEQAIAAARALGDWLVVKKHLTAGENRAMFAGMMRADGEAIDRVKVGLSRIVAYLLDWSIEDADGKPVVIRDQPTNVVASALDALEPDSYREILTAIEAHEEAMEKAREQEKNAMATAIASSAT
jgi:hypothetical protein